MLMHTWILDDVATRLQDNHNNIQIESYMHGINACDIYMCIYDDTVHAT
jgi:hypothetical protein